jgi:ribosomal-protein-alanine N-acetyltransferase
MSAPDSAPNSARTIIIRQMELRDLDWVCALGRSLPHAPHWPRAAYLAAIDPNAVPQRIALVAEEPETHAGAGFAIASIVLPEAELESIAVAPGLQRQGIGRQLLSALAAQLEAGPITEVVLEVRASNRPAIHLYTQTGFRESGRRSRYYIDPIEDAVIMKLNLDQFAPN